MAATEEKIVRVQLAEQLVGVFRGEVTPKSIEPGKKGFVVEEHDRYLQISRRDPRRPNVEVVACIGYGPGVVIVKERPYVEPAATEATPQRVSTDGSASSSEPAGRRARSTSRTTGSDE